MVFPCLSGRQAAIEKVTPQDTPQVELVKGLVKELSERQIQILNLIESNNHITKREMAKRIGISTTAIDKYIDTLKEKKLIERKGGRKEGYWQIIDEAE